MIQRCWDTLEVTEMLPVIRHGADRLIGYPMPNDDAELDRMDFFHSMMLFLHGEKLHLAPIKSPHRILDMGTGTGIWAIEMGMQQN